MYRDSKGDLQREFSRTCGNMMGIYLLFQDQTLGRLAWNNVARADYSRVDLKASWRLQGGAGSMF